MCKVRSKPRLRTHLSCQGRQESSCSNSHSKSSRLGRHGSLSVAVWVVDFVHRLYWPKRNDYLEGEETSQERHLTTIVLGRGLALGKEAVSGGRRKIGHLGHRCWKLERSGNQSKFLGTTDSRWTQTHALNGHIEEFLELVDRHSIVRYLFDRALHPVGQLRDGRRLTESFVAKNDGSVVVSVTNDTAYGLVYSSVLCFFPLCIISIVTIRLSFKVQASKLSPSFLKLVFNIFNSNSIRSRIAGKWF